MADFQSDWKFNVDTSDAIASIKNLQRQISAFHQAMQQSGSASNAAASANMQRNLLNGINSTGKFAATMTTVKTETESFTNSLERNRLSMGQYFRFAGASTKTFGRMFSTEFNTLNKVARERVKTLQTQYVKMGRDASGAMKAMAVRPLVLDMNNLGTQVMMTAQKQQIFNQMLRQGSTNLLNFGKNTQWAGRQLMVGFTIPLTIMGTAAVREFKKIEEQVVKFRRVYGDMFSTDVDTEKAIDSIRTIAEEFTKYGIAIEETIGLAASVAQMGAVGSDLTNQVTEATRLAVLGGMEQQKALDTTISLTNAFGIATEDLAGKINFLNAAENQTILAIDDFTEAVPKAGAVVSQLGGSVEDLAFFLTAMREGGVNASQAANALKSSLARLINPTKQAQEDLSKLGIDVMGIVEGNVGDLKGTIMELGEALDGLQPLERSRALEELFGKFQFARMSTLFQNISKEGSQAQKILQLTQSTSAQLQVLADRELKRVEESPAFKLEKQFERLKASLAPIGAEFAKLIVPILEFANGILKSFNEMDGGVKSFVVGLVAVLGGIAPIALMTFGLVANGVANLIKGFSVYRTMLAKLAGVNNSVLTTTQYMTNEQLEAASVAMSLAQSHQHLTAQFTSEAASIQALIMAYQKATTAQQAYNQVSQVTAAMNVARPVVSRVGSRRVQSSQGTPPPVPGFSNGVLSVPGPKGAGDIVPAMLAPGEAVIPAKTTAKYGGFISDIINDNLPGYRFGLNPFASMMGRSRVAVRTKQSDLTAMLASGKNARYESAFTTGTGADYIAKSGLPNPSQQRLRTDMEQKMFGLGPDTPVSARPTYGYARISPIQAFINKIMFGFKGKQYNAVTSGKTIGNRGSQAGYLNPKTGMYGPTPDFKKDSLSRYGDVDLITKRSVGRRSTAAVTDALMDYERSGLNPNFKMSSIPMGGRGGDANAARFDRLSNPFGTYQSDPINNPRSYTSNPKPPYVETYTPGGFDLKEVSKIRVASRSDALALQQLVDQSGLKIRVTPQNAPGLVKALANMFGTRFADGVVSVPGTKGAGDVVPAMLSPGEAVIPTKLAQKYSGLIDGMVSDSIPGYMAGRVDSSGSVSKFDQIMDYDAPRGRRSARSSAQIIDSAGGSGKGVATQLGDAGVSAKNAMKLMSEAADKAKLSLDDLRSYVEILTQEIANAPKKQSGEVGSGEKLVSSVREKTGFDPKNQGDSFSHIDGGATASAGKLQSMGSSGELQTYSKAELDDLMSRDPGQQLAVKSGLGIPLPQKLNVEMANSGAKIEEFSSAVQNTGIEKWNDSIKHGGGNVEKLSGQTQILENEFQRLTAAVPSGTKIFDSKKQAAASGVPATSLQEVYGTARSNTKSQTPELTKVLDTAAATPTEVRGLQGISPGRSKRKPLTKGTLSELEKSSIADGVGGTVNKAVDASVDEAINSAKRKLEIKSPSEKASRELGLPISQGIADGIRDGKPAVDAALKDVTGNAVGGARRSSSGPPPIPSSSPPRIPAGPPPPKLPTGFGPDPFAPALNKIDLEKPVEDFNKGFRGKLKGFGTKLGSKALNAVEDSNIGRRFVSKLASGAGNTVVGRNGQVIYDGDKGVTYDRSGNVIAAGAAPSMATSQSGSGVSDAKPGQPAADLVVDADGSPVLDSSGNPISQKDAKKAQSRQNRQARAGRVGALMMSASMTASMAAMAPGKVGEVAQKAMPALFGLSMLAPMLLALPAPMAALVAVVAAGVGAFFLMNQALKKAKEEAIKTAQGMAMTSEKLEQLAEFTGAVTASQEASQVRGNQLAGEDAKKRQFGQSFIDSEPGTAMLDNVRQRIEDGDINVSDDIANQLAYAVLQGAITKDEAGSIGAALSAELKDFSITAKVSGELTRLMGPSGEDLTTEPLRIALAIQEESMQDQTMAYENSLQKIEDNAAVDGGTIGNLIGGGIMTAAGAVMAATGFLAPLGIALAAAGIGTMVASGINEGVADSVENIAAAGIAVQLGAEQIAQNQGLLDSVSQRYNLQISELEAKKDAAKTDEEILDLENQIAAKQLEKETSLDKIKASNSEIYATLVAQAKALGPKFNASIEASIDEQFKDASGALKAAANLAKESLGSMDDGDFKIALQIGLASGEFDPVTVTNLINANEESGGEIETSIKLMIDAEGTAETNQVMQLLSKAGVGAARYSVILDYIRTDGGEFEDDVEALSQIASMATEYGITIDINSAGSETIIGEVSKFIEETDKMPDTVSFDVITKYMADYPGMDPETKTTLQGILDNWDILSGGKNTVNYEVLVDFAIGKADPAAILGFYLSTAEGQLAQQSQQFTGPIGSADTAARKQRSSLLDQAVAWFTGMLGSVPIVTEEDDPIIPESTSGAVTDPFKDILSQLKELRNYTVDATGSVEELLRVLGDGKKITVFRGMEQLSLGAKFGKEFAGYLSGLDEDARSLFVEFKKAGPVLTETGRAMQKAFMDVEIGEFQLNIVSTLDALANKAKTLEILAELGLEYADALSIATNETLALGIATGAIDASELQKLKNIIADLRVKDEVSKTLDQINQDINDFVSDMATKRQVKLNYSKLQQEAILNDATLSGMVKLGQAGADAFKTRLSQITSSVDFLQGVFDKGFSNAMESFTVQEQKIQLKFDIDNKEVFEVISKAKADIATINYNLDDYEAGLTRLEIQEDDINKKYEKRAEALDRIEEINESIARQQKSQIGIADALSKGDISAAASLAQQARADEAKERAKKEKDLLELNKEKELAALKTSVNGVSLTRIQIEEQIKTLQQEVFEIEETKLEIAQRALDLAELAKQKRIEELEVLERTRAAWEGIKNQVDLAKISSDDFLSAIQAALDAVPGLIAAYEGKSAGSEAIAPLGLDEEPEQIKPRVNSSYTVAKEAQAAGNTRAAVIDRDTAKAAAIAAVRDGGLTVGNTTIKASSTLDFAEQVQSKVLANREAFANATSASQKAALTKENINLMQTSGLRFARGGMVPGYGMGGMVSGYAMGGKVKGYATGGMFKSMGTDTVPAMLTPGEFVVKRHSVNNFGVDGLKSINNGTYSGESVYNYSVNVNVKSDANPNEIAKSVITQIRSIDSQKVRGNRF